MVANFNDTRCTDSGRVCPTDSLLFTCTANEIILLRVTLPSGFELVLSSPATTIGTPDGFSVESNATVNADGSFNYILSLSIENAFLLAGRDINVSDDNTITNQYKCPMVGKFTTTMNT